MLSTIKNSLETGVHQIEYRIIRPDGEVRWVLGSGQLFRGSNGDPGRMIGVCTDITERKRSDELQRFLVEAGSLLASSLEYEETLQQVARLSVTTLADACGVNLLDSEGNPRYVAAAHASADMERVVDEILANYPPSLRPDNPALIAMQTGASQVLPEVPVELVDRVARDERHKELILALKPGPSVAVPLMLHGRAIGYLALIRTAPSPAFTEADVQTAEELARRAALAIENARLYRESQQIQEDLRRANAAKDSFLGMVSHELRTPITTIYSGTKFLRTSDGNLDEETRNEVLADVEKESQRLNLIVENLLALARTELGKEVSVEPVAVQRIVSGVLDRVGKARPFRDFQVHGEADLPTVKGVPIYLDLVLRNLLDNADKYSPQGKPVEIRVAKDGDGHVQVTVRDYGPGIPEKELTRVFERFYRLESTAKTVSGAGMGLPVCKTLIEAQGGRISSRNCPDGGLEVTISLPLHETSVV